MRNHTNKKGLNVLYSYICVNNNLEQENYESQRINMPCFQ